MMKLRSLAIVLALGVAAPAIARADDQKSDDPKAQDGQKPDGQKPDGQKPDGQGRRGRGMRGNMADRLKDVLGLTDDQVKKIKDIEEAARAEWKKARETDKGQKPDRQAMRQQMKDRMEKLNAQIRGVLTDEQKAKFDDYLAKQAENRKNRQKPDGSKPSGTA
jgi:Spy/CpxP family protein refolding chaperone